MADFQQPAETIGGGRNKTAGKDNGECFINYTRERLFALLNKQMKKFNGNESKDKEAAQGCSDTTESARD